MQAAAAAISHSVGSLSPAALTHGFRGNKVDHPRGYEVDLAKAIAKQLGIAKINWVYTPWTGLFAPGTKKFALRIAGL